MLEVSEVDLSLELLTQPPDHGQADTFVGSRHHGHGHPDFVLWNRKPPQLLNDQINTQLVVVQLRDNLGGSQTETHDPEANYRSKERVQCVQSALCTLYSDIYNLRAETKKEKIIQDI